MLSSSFIKKVMQKLSLLDRESLQDFVLRLSQERDFFQIILDSMAEGVLITNEQHVVQYVNRTAEVLLARKCEQIKGNSVLDCTGSAQFLELIKSAILDNARVRNKEVALYRSFERILNVNVFPLYKGEKHYGHAILFMDVTHEKVEQQKLRRAESMAALSSISAGIAHEIKNPLGAMDIHLQLMEQVVEELDSTKGSDLSRYLHIVRDEVARLNDIVVDFLSAIRPLKLRLAPVSLQEIIKELADFLGADLNKHGVSLVMELESKISPLMLDGPLFRQVLLNLVKNAQEALPDGGVIKISTKQSSDYVQVAVEDNGIGIEADRVNAIFEPYNSTKPSGTGLGLTIVYRIVKEHGGDISVESELGKGARFLINLPLREKRASLIEYMDK